MVRAYRQTVPHIAAKYNGSDGVMTIIDRGNRPVYSSENDTRSTFPGAGNG
jgi:hypothetical protein